MIFSAEWTYLLRDRKVGGEDSVFSYVRLKYGSNATDTVTGVIIYPDDFSFSEAGVASMPFGARRPITQINAADWATLEEAGCIFLPATSFLRYASNMLDFVINSPANYLSYWSSSAHNASSAYMPSFFFLNPILSVSNMDQRCYGYPVRLAQDL